MEEQKKPSIRRIKIKRVEIFIIVFILLIYSSFFIQVPYFIFQPGSALELSSIIKVQEGNGEAGEFMLTSVSSVPSSLSMFIYAQFNSYLDVVPEKYILSKDEKPEDYYKRQLKIMKISQDNAVVAAFQYLNLPINVKQKGVAVMALLPNLPASNYLQVGDIINEMDDYPVKNTDDFLNHLSEKKEGEVVKVSFLRENRTHTVSIPLVNLSKAIGDEEEIPKDKIGFGFSPYNEKIVNPSRKVMFHTENIGGPSAGLMFSLEIINQLTEDDLTKGYKIAGTGTLDSNGVVGQIGEARLKVKAAYEQGAEIFFVPKDKNADDENQRNAVESNKDLGSPLQIVPVSTLDDAVDFLKKLPAKG